MVKCSVLGARYGLEDGANAGNAENDDITNRNRKMEPKTFSEKDVRNRVLRLEIRSNVTAKVFPRTCRYETDTPNNTIEVHGYVADIIFLTFTLHRSQGNRHRSAMGQNSRHSIVLDLVFRPCLSFRIGFGKILLVRRSLSGLLTDTALQTY